MRNRTLKAKGKKKSKKGPFRRLNDWLHLWLGLISGIVVFIVSITGCIYVFEDEFRDMMEPWKFVTPQDKPFLPPSQLIDKASLEMPGKKATGLSYSTRNEAAAVGFMHREEGKRAFTAVFLNPYSGELIRKQKLIGPGTFDFFRFIMDGHRALWLPYEIGRPVVGVSTLIFILMLITGLIMWWPKRWNRSNINKSFKIKWRASFKRVNYDLHNVLGFYSLLLALIIAVTGLVWSFEWFEKSLYYVTSGGESLPEHSHPHSDITAVSKKGRGGIPNMDRAWYLCIAQEPDMKGMFVGPPREKDDVFEFIVYQDEGSYFNRNVYHYDQYTLEELESSGPHGGKFSEAALADQISMLNLDMHIGSALGLPGKILAFLASLICASLPVTGFLVWWNKKKKKPEKRSPAAYSKNSVSKQKEDILETLPS